MAHRDVRTLVAGAMVIVVAALGCARSAPPIVAHPNLRQDYTTEPDGPHPSTFDSGQQAVLTYTPDQTALPHIVDGRSVIDFHNPGRGAGYASGQLSAGAVYIEADWNFAGAGSTGSAQLALCLFAGPLPSGFLGDTAAPDSPAHVVFLQDHFEYGVWESGTLSILAKVPYGKTFSDESLHAAVYLRRDLGQAWVLAPTGVLFGPYSHPSISATDAPYVTAEQFYGDADTDRRVEIQRWSASSQPRLP